MPIESSKSTTNAARAEHTELGWVIGSVRDSVFGGPAEEKRVERTRQNDDIAHVAADVVAALPHVRWFGAGLSRAVLLHDPNPNGQQHVVFDAARNFVGGAAMNKIMKSSSFGTIQHATAMRYGLAARGEVANFFTTGVGLGLVRGITDNRLWYDEQHKLKLPSATAVIETGMITGIANIPAGFVGTRLASIAGESTGILSRVGTGIVSGGMSGGVFSGTDAYVRTGDLTQAAVGFRDGLLIGGVTGGITAGAERIRQDSFYFLNNKLRSAPQDTAKDGPIITGGTSAEHPKVLDFPAETRTLRTLSEQLRAPKEGTYYQSMLNPFGPVKFWNARQYASNVHQQLRPAQIYEFEGTRIVVPKGYAAKLEEVRQLRLASEAGDQQAQTALSEHPLKSRLLPEDLIPLLDRVPDQTKVKNVELLGTRDAWNKYYEEFYDWARVRALQGQPFIAAATAHDKTGTIRFYEGKKHTGSRPAEQVMDHEQAHLNHDPHYEQARAVDKRTEASPYGYANRKESEAELESLAFLGDTRTFIEAGQQAPVRMTLLARKLESTLSTATGKPTSVLETLRNRIGYINENVQPEANRILTKIIDDAQRNNHGWTASQTKELYVRLNPGSPIAAEFAKNVRGY